MWATAVRLAAATPHLAPAAGGGASLHLLGDARACLLHAECQLLAKAGG